MATGKPGYCGGVCNPKKKVGGNERFCKSNEGWGRDFEMENSNTGQWWGFKKNRCNLLVRDFWESREGGAEVARMVGKGVCGQRSFLEWDGRILRGRGLLVFFGGVLTKDCWIIQNETII